ncbi:PREDICTED: alpha-2-HS-glycoprotein [Tinamus guttatus]|uniref:alpha-2-HS-glycoprotein n=1 Tax=Tinamus guttatus TaxID=94827 RepID=UPI00052E6DF6|nr:PREDICTED: alpha-2-HS-glycoprotein [Tinamus guttatus]
MKVLVALILLVQLPIHKAVPAAPPPPPLRCDDPESEAAAEIAVNYINDHSHHGYKFALNRIENVRVLPQGPNNQLLFLELDLLETKCHVLNPVPLENCTVRPFEEHAVEGDCDVKLQNLDGKLSVLASKCHSHADSAEDVIRVCPDCPLLENLNNTEVLAGVAAALNEHNSKTPDAYLRLLEIGRARIQVTATARAILTRQQRSKANVDACQLLPEDEANFGFCTATIATQPTTDVQVDCKLYGHQPGVTYPHPGQDTSAGLLPNVQGFTNHNLRLSHNNPVASESSSSEFPTLAIAAKSVAKRAVAEAAQHNKAVRPVGFAPPPPPCPGRIRYFKI